MRSFVVISVLVVAYFGCLTAEAFPSTLQNGKSLSLSSASDEGITNGASDPLTLLDIEHSSDQLHRDHISAADDKLHRSTRNLGPGLGGWGGKFGGLGHGFGSFSGLGFGFGSFHGLGGGVGGFKPFFHKLG